MFIENLTHFLVLQIRSSYSPWDTSHRDNTLYKRWWISLWTATAALMHNSAHASATGTCGGIWLSVWNAELWNLIVGWISSIMGFDYNSAFLQVHLKGAYLARTSDTWSVIWPKVLAVPRISRLSFPHKAHPLFLLHPVCDAAHALPDLLQVSQT